MEEYLGQTHLDIERLNGPKNQAEQRSALFGRTSLATDRVNEGLIEDLPLQLDPCVDGCVYSGHWMVDGVMLEVSAGRGWCL